MRIHQPDEERTSFQEHGPFDPRIDSSADVAMVYGIDDTFEQRVNQWRKAGYRVHVMTGVSWGHYADYVRGEWDSQKHFDDAQTADGNFKLEHGVSQGHDIYYMMPSLSYVAYLSEKLKRVVDAGAIALHLEEPEFWVRAGYEESFRREWQVFYGEAWADPKSSCDARYRSGKLMQYAYTRALTILCDDIKRYAREHGVEDFKCYVPTHSLINYAHWRIVSPESKLLEIPSCDGLIGQVWTGTSRTPNYYRGVRRERPFEAGLCEYAACIAIARQSRLRLWQLADPIEDNPNYCWDDYRRCWESDVVAALLCQDSTHFEIMPWPTRIFTRTYPSVNLDSHLLADLIERYIARLRRIDKARQAADMHASFNAYLSYIREHGATARAETLGFADTGAATTDADTLHMSDLLPTLLGFYKHLATWPDATQAATLRDAMAAFFHDPTDNRESIPASYASELQTVFNALTDMDWPNDTRWISGQSGVAVAIADSLMFQRGTPEASDADLSSFYGLTLPLLKSGVALTLAQLERVHEPRYLDETHVLLLTYEGMKPPSAQAHVALVNWVQTGHVLMLVGEGDAYNSVREWWNTAELDYASPQAHLTELLGLGRAPAAGMHACGSGFVVIESQSPAALAHQSDGADVINQWVKAALQKIGQEWRERNCLALRRGPYVIASGMDETADAIDLQLEGVFVNLFDPALGLVTSPRIAAGTRWLLCDVTTRPPQPWVLACAGRVRDEAFADGVLRFNVRGLGGTRCAVRVALPAAPHSVDVGAATSSLQRDWDASSRTLLLQFDHQVDGVDVVIEAV